MNRNSGDSGNTMPPLVAMEGMQANQEAEFMSMNMPNQHHQNMPPHEDGGKTIYLIKKYECLDKQLKAKSKQIKKHDSKLFH